MRKFGIVAGFLGAGKTSCMLALDGYFRQKGIACRLISNDIVGGELVDALYSEKQGSDVKALPGGCICYRTRELSQVLEKAFEDGAEIVLSDIPGCGVGALDMVYRDCEWKDTALAPFVTVLDPQRLSLLSGDDSFYQTHLPEDMKEIIRSEILEADAVVLNKIDTITAEEREAALGLIRGVCPQAEVLFVSARTGEGIAELAEHILSSETSLAQPRGLGSEVPTVSSLMKLSRYDCGYHAKVCCDDFSPDEYIRALMEQARFAFASLNANMPHMKVFASSPDGRFGKYSLTGIDYPLEADLSFPERATELTVRINAGFVCPSALAAEVMKQCIDTAGKNHNLDTMIFTTGCR